MQTIKRTSKAVQRGFTLIELLVVIVILAILAAVVVPNVISRGDDARQSKTVADIKTIDDALERYKLDTGNYPTAETLDCLVSNTLQEAKWGGPYIKGNLPLDGWGHPYQYKYPGEHGEYDIKSAGKDGNMGTADDVGNWTN